MNIKEAISELFFPKEIKCIVCGDELFANEKYSICRSCELAYNKKFCLSCGRGISDMAEFCDYCQARPCEFTKARAPFLFENNVKRLVHKLKYGNARYLAEIFAQILKDCFDGYNWQIDAVTYVPMHKKRFKQRGYNQAELIAREFCNLSALPLHHYLDRTVYSKNFARMTKAQREKSIAGTIEIKQGEKPQKTVLLIDDVFTTGTTINECAKILKKAGAKLVYVLTVATAKNKPLLY